MNNKKKYKNYKIKHALITVINCKRCSEVFKYTETKVKDDPFCKRCDQNHVYCKHSYEKCCKRFQYNDLKCKNCTENGFEYERTRSKQESSVQCFYSKFERGKKTGRFHEQCYIQLSSATDIKNYSLKNYTRCTVHRNCYCNYFDLNVHCDICDDSCKEFRELLIVHNSFGNQLDSEEVGPFIFGNKNFDLNIGSKTKTNKNLEKIFDEA
ncbi:30538_t:CDS:2, partial [Gigaspora margarita]